MDDHSPRGLPSDVAAGLDRVSFGYDSDNLIVRSLTLSMRRGRVLAMLGPNGSGKTTLLKLLAGVLQPREGHVRAISEIAFVPQLTQVTFAYTVLDMVMMGRARQVGLFSTPSARDEDAAITALDRVGLRPLAMRSFDTLSGGERQLVLFARALAANATILALDEPMASLDLSHQGLVLQRIRRLSRDDGMTVAFSTHQPEHAAAVADDVALMFRDRRVVAGTAAATLTASHLSELFGISVRRATVDQPHGTSEVFVPSWDL